MRLLLILLPLKLFSSYEMDFEYAKCWTSVNAHSGLDRATEICNAEAAVLAEKSVLMFVDAVNKGDFDALALFFDIPATWSYGVMSYGDNGSRVTLNSYQEIKDFYREFKDSMPENYSHSEVYEMDSTYHNPSFANVTAFWKMYDNDGNQIDRGISTFVLRNQEKRFKIVMVDD